MRLFKKNVEVFICVLFVFLFVVCLLFYTGVQQQEKIVSIRDTIVTQDNFELLRKTLKNEYDSYGRDMGLSGYKACMTYSFKESKICKLIYLEEINKSGKVR